MTEWQSKEQKLLRKLLRSQVTTSFRFRLK